MALQVAMRGPFPPEIWQHIIEEYDASIRAAALETETYPYTHRVQRNEGLKALRLSNRWLKAVVDPVLFRRVVIPAMSGSSFHRPNASQSIVWLDRNPAIARQARQAYIGISHSDRFLRVLDVDQMARICRRLPNLTSLVLQCSNDQQAAEFFDRVSSVLESGALDAPLREIYIDATMDPQPASFNRPKGPRPRILVFKQASMEAAIWSRVERILHGLNSFGVRFSGEALELDRDLRCLASIPSLETLEIRNDTDGSAGFFHNSIVARGLKQLSLHRVRCEPIDLRTLFERNFLLEYVNLPEVELLDSGWNHLFAIMKTFNKSLKRLDLDTVTYTNLGAEHCWYDEIIDDWWCKWRMKQIWTGDRKDLDALRSLYRAMRDRLDNGSDGTRLRKCIEENLGEMQEVEDKETIRSMELILGDIKFVFEKDELEIEGSNKIVADLGWIFE